MHIRYRGISSILGCRLISTLDGAVTGKGCQETRFQHILGDRQMLLYKMTESHFKVSFRHNDLQLNGVTTEPWKS